MVKLNDSNNIQSYKVILEENFKDDSEELKQRCQELEMLNNNIDGGIEICELDDEFKIIYANDGLLSLLGYNNDERDQVVGCQHIKFIHPEDKELVVSSIHKNIKETNKFLIEYRLCQKNGNFIWVIDKGNVVEYKGKLALQCLLTDITELKKQENALTMSEKQVEITLNYSDIVLFDYNLDTKQMFISKQDAEIYKLPRVVENAIETFINSDIILPESIQFFRELYKKIENGAAFSEDIIHVHDSVGKEHILELKLTNVLDSRGKSINVIGVKKDITEVSNQSRTKYFGDAMMFDRFFTYEANVTKNKIINYNRDWESMIDINEDITFTQLKDLECEKLIDPQFKEIFDKMLSPENIIYEFENGQKLLKFEFKKKIDKKVYHWFEKTINIFRDKYSNDICIRCFIVDVNEKKEKELQELEAKKYFDFMVSRASEIYEINITENVFLAGNEKWANTYYNINLSESYSNAINTIKQKIIFPKDRERFEFCFSRDSILKTFDSGNKEIVCEYRRLDSNNHFKWVRGLIHLYQDPNTNDVKAFTYVEDIEEEKAKSEELIFNSEHDLLTNYYNKSTTEIKINQFLATSEAKVGNHVFFIIDIDRFKLINDNFGHAFGDAILSQFTATMSELFREIDILGRIGGDEFVILMKNIQSNRVALFKAEEIIRKVYEVYTQNGIQYTVSASIGIAYYGMHGKTYKELYMKSDTALYASKRNGRNQYTVYDAEMQDINKDSKEINQSALFEVKNFEKNITEYVFRILYEAFDKEVAIKSVLELIGKHYNVSRAYVFEDSEEGDYTFNTFEWCNKGIASQMDNLQNVSYKSLNNYKQLFNDEGIFYLPNIDVASEEVRDVIEVQNIKTMMQFAIIRKGEIVGFIGFDQCDFARITTKKELSEMRNVSNILGVFILEMRTIANRLALYNMAIAIVDGLGSYAYVSNPKTFEVLFINNATKKVAPNAVTGGKCYKEFWNRETPCENCPMMQLGQVKDKTESLELYNPNLKLWIKATASWISWIDNKKACLIDSIDITEFKK